MQGISLLPLALRRSGYSHQYSAEIGGVAALVGRLIDLAATLTQLSFELSANDQRRFRNLASTVWDEERSLPRTRSPTQSTFNLCSKAAGLRAFVTSSTTWSLGPALALP